MPCSPCINLVLSVAHTDNARLVAGARAAVAGAISIDERDIFAQLLKARCGPRTNYSGSHHDDIERMFCWHCRGIISLLVMKVNEMCLTLMARLIRLD